MIIGVPKEVKTHEYRVGLIPASVRELIRHGHDVVIETQAGAGIGFSDKDYEQSGARIVADAEAIFAQASLIVKVKEPQLFECQRLQEDQVLFTYLHLAPDPEQTQALLDAKCTAIAYETVADDQGHLPLLSPMSEVAGRMSIQAGAHCLEKAQGGNGVLLGGVPGVEPAHVVVIGGGVVGTNAARMAMGMEARVTVLDKSLERLQALDCQFGGRMNTVFATLEAIEQYVMRADLVIGAVLVAGGAAPQLISRDLVSRMRAGSVLVDVAIDQGGCAETSRPTTHDDPSYTIDGTVHYCVSNMPGAVPRTAAIALNNATLPYVLAIADKGYKKALQEDPSLLAGLNVHKQHLTHAAVAESLQRPYKLAAEALLI